MLNFFYNPNEPDVARQAKALLEAWWDAHHASKVRHLVPGHRIIVDDQPAIITKVNADAMSVCLLFGGTTKTLKVEPSTLFRHPLTDRVADIAIGSLPLELARVVRVGESVPAH